MNEKHKATKEVCQFLRFLFGIVMIVTLIIFIKQNYFSEFGHVSGKAENFIELVSQGKYLEAYNYVDTTKIKIEDLKEASSLAAHSCSGTYFHQSYGNQYVIGFKSILDDDKTKDNVLEFYFKKVKDDWRVVYISKRSY